MRYYWRSHRLSGQRWELVLTDCDDLNDRVLRAPGYQSTKLRDILEACWYLNSGFKSRLPEHRLQLLDQIKMECEVNNE